MRNRAKKESEKMVRTRLALEILEKLDEIEVEMAVEGREVPLGFQLGVLMAVKVLTPHKVDRAVRSL